MAIGIFFTASAPDLGAQQLQLLRQAQGLQAAGWKPRILCRPGSRLAEEAARRGLRVERVRFGGPLDPGSARRVAALLRKHRPLAVVCHGDADANTCALAAHLAAAIGLLRPRPRLVRMRTDASEAAGAFGCNRLFDITFTTSQTLRAQLLGNPKIRPERIRVLYPGIDFAQLERAAEAPLPPALAQRLDAAGGPMIVHDAMLHPEKGHAFMLRLLPALLLRFPKLLYVATGEGDLLAALQEQARTLGLAQHVHFTGTLRPVAPLIRRADVLVMPSLFEPLGMSQIEALALGVPVVVSDVGGLRETVRGGETGLLCPPPDQPGAPAAWAAALTRKLSDPAGARAMARRGREQVLAQFDPLANLAALMQACR